MTETQLTTDEFLEKAREVKASSSILWHIDYDTRTDHFIIEVAANGGEVSRFLSPHVIDMPLGEFTTFMGKLIDILTEYEEEEDGPS